MILTEEKSVSFPQAVFVSSVCNKGETFLWMLLILFVYNNFRNPVCHDDKDSGNTKAMEIFCQLQ